MSGWSDDEDLMRDLGEAVRRDRTVPPRFREAARAAFAWRTVDRELEELLTLTEDSAAGEAVVLRSTTATTPRVLSFTGGGTSLEVEVDGDLLTGQVLPPQPGRLVLRSAQGETVGADVDESGFFVAAGVPGGNVRFEVTVGGARLATGWLRL